MPEIKECTKCRTFQPIENFAQYQHNQRDRKVPRSRCRTCMNAERAAFYRRSGRFKNRDGDLPDHRTCRVCRETKPLTDFHRNGRSRRNGEPNRRHICGACTNEHNRKLEKARLQRNPEHQREIERKAQQRWRDKHREHYREYQREYQKAWQARNRERGREIQRNSYARRKANAFNPHPDPNLHEMPAGSPVGGFLPGSEPQVRPEPAVPPVLCRRPEELAGQPQP